MSAPEEWVTDHDGALIDSLDHGLLEIEIHEVHTAGLYDLGFVLSVASTDEANELFDRKHYSTRPVSARYRNCGR